MGDNPLDRYHHEGENSENQDNLDNSEEEFIIEEYETFYVPQHLLDEDQTNSEACDVKSSATHQEYAKQNTSGCGLRKEKDASKIKTITRIDEETENVVILIRPRRRSVSPTGEKNGGFGNISGSCGWTHSDLPKSQTLKRDLSTNSSGENICDVEGKAEGFGNISESCGRTHSDLPSLTLKRDLSSNSSEENTCDIEHDNTISSVTLNNYKHEKNLQNETNCDRNVDVNTETNSSNGNSHTLAENTTVSTFEENVSVFSDLNGNDIISTEENLPEVELISKYENQGARPKTTSNLPALGDDNLAVTDKEIQCAVMDKSSSKPGISKEANEKVKKLKENGHYDVLVKNSNVPFRKGEVNDIVNKLNIDSSNQATDEDDVLIWELMKSLKERSNKMESRHVINQEINPSDSSPEDKCDWSYEKATLSKNKYLSRRLQTKEIGQVKVITFMSPAKEKGHVKITPLKVSRTLPLNVKNIFQQKMEELKNKRRVCLTGGKELMYTTINIDDLCLEGSDDK